MSDLPLVRKVPKIKYKKPRARKDRHRKYELVKEFKDVPCADCGIKYPTCVMDFDHRDPSNKIIALAKGYACLGMKKLKEEIAKCDVVCSNCHRIRTWLPSTANPPVEIFLWQAGII
jgi:hypothetical protein